jgi:hypothetical protein
MAAIIDDGPRIWVVDTLNRKLGRVVAAASAVALLAQMHLLAPGNARMILAVGAIALIGYACRPQPSNPAATVDDLAEVEEIVMRLAERVDRHDNDPRFVRLLELVTEIREQIRSRG